MIGEGYHQDVVLYRHNPKLDLYIGEGDNLRSLLVNPGTGEDGNAGVEVQSMLCSRKKGGEDLVLETVETTRKVVKLSLAGLFVAGAMAAVVPNRAEATPIYSVCYPGDEVGYYEWYDDGQGNFTDSIGINDCALDSMGAGSEDRARVLEHELEHAQGYGHSDDPYDVMYPHILITGY